MSWRRLLHENEPFSSSLIFKKERSRFFVDIIVVVADAATDDTHRWNVG
jgi:hypothetical protein